MKEIIAIFSLLSASLFTNSQPYFFQLEKQERKENKLVIWEYGLPRFEQTFAQKKVASYFGIYFNHVAGCVVNDKLVKRIKEHNQKVGKKLTKKLGANWVNMVYDAIDSVYRIDTTLINNFHIDRFFLDSLIKLLDAINEPFEFRVQPTADPMVFIIDALYIDKDWNVTDRSLLKIEATYPNITYKFIDRKSDDTITGVIKLKVDEY